MQSMGLNRNLLFLQLYEKLASLHIQETFFFLPDVYEPVTFARAPNDVGLP